MKIRNLITLGLVTGALSYLSYEGIANYLFNTMFTARDFNPDYYNSLSPEFKKMYDERKEFYSKWIEEIGYEDLKLETFDNLTISARLIRNLNSNNFIVLVHGYNTNKEFMYDRAKGFYELGYNCLLVDLRGYGDSTGQYTTFGFKESLDICLWVDYLAKHYKECNICLLGHSMGAASVMMALNYEMPSNVKCVIEDGGFTTMKECIAYMLKKEYGLTYPDMITKIIDNKMKEKFGFSMDDVKPLEALKNNNIPICFVHGE